MGIYNTNEQRNGGINMKWTKKQNAFIMQQRSEGIKVSEIRKNLKEEFNLECSPQQLSSKVYVLKKLNSVEVIRTPDTRPSKAKGKSGKYMSYTQDKVDFVYGCVRNNFPTTIIVQGFKEQFNEVILPRQIDYIIGTKRPTGAEPIPAKKPETSSKVTKGNLAKELEKFMALHGSNLSKTDKLSLDTVKELIQPVVTTNEIRQEAVDGVVESLKPVYARTRYHWTAEEELNLVCNYYEYSIDEAREVFQRPYYAISKRLEMIVDSTEPKYISLLMTATKVIKERKRVSDKEAKTGFLKRRKERKQAKRLAKNNRKIAKVEKKLNKMKGE